jgi:hypothetical protein
MIGSAIHEGMRSATRRPGLVSLLWAWNLALAGLVVLPFWAWIRGAASVSPVTDVLLDGADLGVIIELLVADARGATMLAAAVGGLVLLALLSGAFLSGGILEVVATEGDGRPLLHRFFGGAGRFFGRFVRLLLVAAVTAAPVIGVLAAVLAAATGPLATGGSERAALWGTIIVQAGVGLGLAYFILALDYARAITVLSDSRSMIRAWLRGLAFVLRRTPGVATIGLLAAIGVVASIGASSAFDVAYAARSWVVILGAILVHQSMMFVRTAVRVGQIGAQARYWGGVQPPPVAIADAGAPADAVSMQSPAGNDVAGTERE